MACLFNSLTERTNKMADLGFQFKSEEVEGGSFEPLPEGEYVCMFTESEEKPTKAGTGAFIEMKMEVVEGNHQNRVLFERLNIKNPNEKAVEIAYQTLKSICEACGKPTIQNTDELNGIRFIAKVVVDGEYNRIKKYKSIKEKSAPATSSSDGAAKKPWEK
jgi:hypothetical protein